MSSISGADVVNLFKNVYGKMVDLLPEDYHYQKSIPFSENEKVGNAFIEAICLTNETGWSLLGSTAGNNELNAAIAGAVQQTEVKPYETVLASLIPWGCISRSSGGGEKSFYAATKHIVKNNLRSHGKLLEILRIYGQAAQALGYISFATATYRGVAFTAGTGTLNGVAFTSGVNTTTKQILFAPGNFAGGVWVGTEGAIVQQIDINGTVVAQGKLLGVEALFGYITVDFIPVAATSATSHRICFEGQAVAKDAPGIINILSSTGTLFGINTATYSLWKGNVYPCTIAGVNSKLTLAHIQTVIAQAVTRGGLNGDIMLDINPRSWATMLTDQAALRKYDGSYKSSEMENGSEALTFYSQSGVIKIRSNRYVMEGIAIGLHLDDWSRSGSAEISFKVPGSSQDLIFPLTNSTSWAFRSYSDQYIFCHAPAKSFLMTNINDESAT